MAAPAEASGETVAPEPPAAPAAPEAPPGEAEAAAAAGGAALPPCELLRVWPEGWDLAALLRGAAAGAGSGLLPPPSRFLHPGVRAEPRHGGGSRLVAAAPLRAGELALADAPLLTAQSGAGLAEALRGCGRDGEQGALRTLRALLGAEAAPAAPAAAPGGDAPGVRAAGPAPLAAAEAERLLEALARELEPPPCDGQGVKEGQGSPAPLLGLWPLASLAGKSLKPNLVRSFVGHQLCLRAVRDVAAGEELVECLFDPRTPRRRRLECLGARSLRGLGERGLREEWADELDAPDVLIAQVEKQQAKAEALLEGGKLEAAFRVLAKATNACSASGKRDPAFTQTFQAFSQVAGCLQGTAEMQLEGLAMALEHATAREAFSSISVGLTATLLGAALDAGLPGDERGRLESLAREHAVRVYGASQGTFEALHPLLAQRLASQAPLGAPAEPAAKRARTEEEPADGSGR